MTSDLHHVLVGPIAALILVALLTAPLRLYSFLTRKRFLLSLKADFFSKAEHAFFDALRPIAEDFGLAVFPKVGLNDIFADRPGARRGQYYRYAQMHVDFLLVREGDCRPIAGIELDGRSHESRLQRLRDEKKDRVFLAARLPLLRFNNGADAKEIRRRLQDVLR